MPTRTGQPSLLLASLAWPWIGRDERASAVGAAFEEDMVVRFEDRTARDLVAGALELDQLRLGLGSAGLRVCEVDLASEVLDAQGHQAAHAITGAALRTRRADGFLARVKVCFDDAPLADRGRRPARD